MLGRLMKVTFFIGYLMMMNKKIKTNKAMCKKCNDIVESHDRWDFRWCKCESIFVDGGKDYIRRGGKPEDIEELSTYE